MLFLFRSAPEVEKRIHSKLFRKFWRSRGTKEPAYITVLKISFDQQIDPSDDIEPIDVPLAERNACVREKRAAAPPPPPPQRPRHGRVR